jgi:hypothetical protein
MIAKHAGSAAPEPASSVLWDIYIVRAKGVLLGAVEAVVSSGS